MTETIQTMQRFPNATWTERSSVGVLSSQWAVSRDARGSARSELVISIQWANIVGPTHDVAVGHTPPARFYHLSAFLLLTWKTGSKGQPPGCNIWCPIQVHALPLNWDYLPSIKITKQERSFRQPDKAVVGPSPVHSLLTVQPGFRLAYY